MDTGQRAKGKGYIRVGNASPNASREVAQQLLVHKKVHYKGNNQNKTEIQKNKRQQLEKQHGLHQM